jgi:hypothetical protein
LKIFSFYPCQLCCESSNFVTLVGRFLRLRPTLESAMLSTYGVLRNPLGEPIIVGITNAFNERQDCVAG